MKPHELDFISLAAGLIFVAIGIGHLLGFNATSLWGLVSGLWPVLIIIGGVALLRMARRTNDH